MIRNFRLLRSARRQIYKHRIVEKVTNGKAQPRMAIGNGVSITISDMHAPINHINESAKTGIIPSRLRTLRWLKNTTGATNAIISSEIPIMPTI